MRRPASLATMPANVRHFAIHADDVERARRFYERVFGWTFEDWGPPDFYRIQTGPFEDPGIWGSLQRRHGAAGGASPAPAPARDGGFTCTISVDSLDDTVAAIEAAGGAVVVPEQEIPGVGRLVYFEDTERNVVGAMQYEPERLAEVVPLSPRRPAGEEEPT